VTRHQASRWLTVISLDIDAGWRENTEGTRRMGATARGERPYFSINLDYLRAFALDCWTGRIIEGAKGYPDVAGRY
jgi:hypothetical protein